MIPDTAAENVLPADPIPHLIGELRYPRHFLEIGPGGVEFGVARIAVTQELLNRAADMIEHLHALAGAAKLGPSFRETVRDGADGG